MDRNDQIRQLKKGVDDLASAVERLDEKTFLGPLGRWTARDVVAHLIGWNRYVIEGSKQIARGELPFYDADPGEDFANVNREHVRKYPARDASLLVAELRKSAGELAEFLRSLDDEMWGRDFGVRHKDQTLTIRDTVQELIIDYRHHLEQILDLRSQA